MQESCGQEITNYFKSVPKQDKKNTDTHRKSKSKCYYLNTFTSFDIETSKLEEVKQSFMYVWQFAFGHKNDINYIVGRTWEQFKELVDIICDSIPDDTRIICHVHNLSYEFQFLSGIFKFMIDDVFCTDRRKVLKAVYKKIEFRCSYLLTNMGLESFTESMGVEHTKLSGDEFNYDIVRYPWTPLSDRELQYCINDVVGLIEAIEVYYSIENDTHYTIPLTSTGFVRRDMKKALRKGVNYKYMLDIQPDLYLFDALHEAFRGGNTHANMWAVDTIQENVKSADRSSSYPDVMCNRQFPITPFKYLGLQTLESVFQLLKSNHALLLRVSFEGVSLKDECWGFPYIPISKCIGIKPKDCVMDNGRVRQTDHEFMMMLTDIDLDIILKEYDTGTMIFLEVWSSQYGELPRCVKDTVISYYKAKTELKGVEGQELYYGKSKAKVNACYGMTVQDPTKIMTLFDDGHFDDDGNLCEYHLDLDNQDREEILKKHSKKGFMPYQWGVWVTAWARYELELGLDIIPDPLNAIYVDTDSIKYIGDIDLTEYNKRCIENSTRNGAYAVDPQGVTHYMGVFEQEETSKKFITQGAKKYCCLFEKDKKHKTDYLKLTCAGVNKKLGALELEENDGINSFRNGFIFIKGGGTNSIYNDLVNEDIEIEGKKLHLSKNVCIVPDVYTLGKTEEYERILDICRSHIDNVINGAKINIYSQNENKNKNLKVRIKK